jgi:glutamate-1-semialdehyde 2,1-aminomutase
MDSALFSYHSRLDEMGPAQNPNVVPGSRGQMGNAGENIVVLPWNDAEQVAALFARRGHEIAAIITEPVLCNSGCLMPAPGFLAELRQISREHGALLIFDEIITGFRMAPGGAQSVFGITPDLATLGKAIAAGLPLSAVAGRKEILELMVSGGVAFGGTFNGNCLSLAAARVSLQELSRDDGAQLKKANQLGEQLMQGISALARAKGIPLQVTGFGTAFSVHFTERTALKDYRDTLADDRNLLREWLSESLEEGIYLLSDGRVYTSIAHTSATVEATLEGFARVLDRWGAKRGAAVQGA